MITYDKVGHRYETKPLTEEQVGIIRDEWLPALRSGKYEQGHGLLRKGDNYCCLGVLCDVLGAEWVGQDNAYGNPPVYHIDEPDQEIIEILPFSLAARVGISPSGEFTPSIMTDEYSFSSLIELNDDGGFTFAEIADFIEAEILADGSELSFRS